MESLTEKQELCVLARIINNLNLREGSDGVCLLERRDCRQNRRSLELAMPSGDRMSGRQGC